MAMGQMISPGVYTRIIDLSEYLADIPGTIGFVPILSKRGPDNKLQFVTSKEQFINMYGEPNLLDYGKHFGQGPYCAWNHLGVSSHLYVLRALPNDATYSHLFIGMQIVRENLEYDISSSSGSIIFDRLKLHPLYMDGQIHTTRTWEDVEGNPDGGVYRETENEWPSMNHLLNLETMFNEEVTGAYMWTDTTAGDVVRRIDGDDVVIGRMEGNWTEGTGGVGVNNGFLMYFRGLGRGDSYNDFAIRITRHSNPELFGIYILDIYEVQSDGNTMITESYNVSFDTTLVDDAGESLFIEDVVNKFSKNIKCVVNRKALRALNEYMKAFYLNDPTLPSDVTQYIELDENGQATDLGYKAQKIEIASLDYDYARSQLESALVVLAEARNMPTGTSSEILTRNAAISAAISEVSVARSHLSDAKQILEDAYRLDILDIGDSNPDTPMIEPWYFKAGSEGSLIFKDQNTGRTRVDTNTARQVLSEAYLGLLEKPDNFDPKREEFLDQDEPLDTQNFVFKKQFVDEVFDLDWIYFSLVYDAGYDPDIKEAARTLCDVYRKDCMLLSDCGDNVDYDDVERYVGGTPSAPSGRPWNTRYAARFESYSRVYDAFTGRDLWLSPVFHMAQTIPLNDRLYELWYASAGFNRGTLSSIKELRWSPKLGERDKLYLNQVNPIVHFPQGYTIWGNLTTQKRPTALQDINVMRLVLYIKRALEQFCKFYIFDFNDPITHEQIKSGIIPFLDRIKARRGLVNFSVEVGADEYEFKNKICHVNVILQPMKVIEKIELNLFVK